MTDTRQPLIFRGRITERTHGETDDALFVGHLMVTDAAEQWHPSGGKLQVWAGWVLADRELSLIETFTSVIDRENGNLEAEFTVRWSDITGYLWTDQVLKVGGHDLYTLLESNVGRWVFMVISDRPLDDLAEILQAYGAAEGLPFDLPEVG